MPKKILQFVIKVAGTLDKMIFLRQNVFVRDFVPTTFRRLSAGGTTFE